MDRHDILTPKFSKTEQSHEPQSIPSAPKKNFHFFPTSAEFNLMVINGKNEFLVNELQDTSTTELYREDFTILPEGISIYLTDHVNCLVYCRFLHDMGPHRKDFRISIYEALTKETPDVTDQTKKVRHFIVTLTVGCLNVRDIGSDLKQMTLP